MRHLLERREDLVKLGGKGYIKRSRCRYHVQVVGEDFAQYGSFALFLLSNVEQYEHHDNREDYDQNCDDPERI